YGDAGFHEVIPVLDALRVAFADEKNDRAGIGSRVVGKTFLPVLREQLGRIGDRIDVVSEGERDDIGGEAVDHGACLFAGAAMRLLDGDVVAGLRLPVGGEGLVEVD